MRYKIEVIEGNDYEYINERGIALRWRKTF